MRPRIAIPIPHSADPEYAQRALPQYERAVEMAGGEPVRVPLDLLPAQAMKMIERCDGVLLPGSKADIDPAKYDAARDPRSAPSDPARDRVDELLLQDAYNMRKPVLGICYGLQILNVYRTGSLLQHIESPVNHEAGRAVAIAHEVEIASDSMLAGIVAGSQAESGVTSGFAPEEKGPASSRAEKASANSPTLAPDGLRIPVNSSHHQSAATIGDGLRVVARSPQDGIVEALEGTTLPDHFVLAVQWHPERSVEEDASSRAIFRALVEAARAKHKELAGEFESV